MPGTNIRFGWDPIVGVVPWLGDVATALFACALIVQAHQMRVPRVVQLRMLLNVAADVLLGMVPVVGDVADVFWRANTKNLRLVERHASSPQPPTPGDYLFVGLVVAALLAIAAFPLLVMYWLVDAALR